jgi:hypothetical protein
MIAVTKLLRLVPADDLPSFLRKGPLHNRQSQLPGVGVDEQRILQMIASLRVGG